MHTFQVIIVGAGISGLSAARTLLQNGIENILVLEAKEKVGGRICSVPYGESLVELGAQWIHGEMNELFELIKTELHLHDQNSWEGKGEFRTPSGHRIDENIVTEVIDWIETTLGDVEDNYTIETFQNEKGKWTQDITMGSYLRKEFQDYLNNSKNNTETLEKFKNAIFQWGMSFQRIDNSCNQMSELSLFRWSEYKTNDVHVYKNFKRGAQNFVDNILVNSSLKSKILTNTAVKCIDWNEDTMKVCTESPNDEYFQCETIMVTCSIGVLKETQHKLFSPPLPIQLINAIDCTGFGPVTKIFLEWESAWWPSDFLGIQFTWPDKYINCCDFDYGQNRDLNETWYKAITGFDPVLDNPNVLLTWLGGPEAVYAERLDLSSVGHTCTKLLRQFTRNPNILHPKSIEISKWNTDPFFRGAYSFRSKQGDDIPGNITAILSEPIYKFDKDAKKKPKLLLAGEALHLEFYSTLHGAFESGQSQAKKILPYLKRKDLKCV